MDELKRVVIKSVVSYRMNKYGRIKVKLAQQLQARNITRNKIRELTGVKYEVVNRYYRGEGIERADLDFLAKVCYVLDCKIEDLLEYEPPEKEP